MGNKGAKGSKSKDPTGKDSKVPPKSATKLTDKDYKLLSEQTGMTKDQINSFFAKFNQDNPDGKLDRAKFMKLYPALRNEPVQNLDEITNFVFRAFDTDHNSFLTFNEFLIGFAITSKGEIKSKLGYTFELYDADHNGSLTLGEIKECLQAMLDLLGADKKTDLQALSAEVMKQLDKNHDNSVSKEEFINGCLASFALRSLLNPFS